VEPHLSSSRDLFPGLSKPVYRTSAPVPINGLRDHVHSLPLRLRTPSSVLISGSHHANVQRLDTRLQYACILRSDLLTDGFMFIVPFHPKICAFIDTQVAASVYFVNCFSVAFAEHIFSGYALSSNLERVIEFGPVQPITGLSTAWVPFYVLHVFSDCSTSPGVSHLARCMVEHLKNQQPELCITDRDVDCVQVAGLCHDLGHGPFSHVWDGQFIPVALWVISCTLFLFPPLLTKNLSPGIHWKHEDASEVMFDDLVAKNNIDLPENDIKFIKALIAGDPSSCSYVSHGFVLSVFSCRISSNNHPQEKPFLFDIVANKRNGIDVDK